MIVFWRWVYHMVLLESLVVASFIDIDLRIIPDGATVPAMAVGVLGGWFLGCVYIVPVWFQDTSLLTAVASISGGNSRFLPGTRVPPGSPRIPICTGWPLAWPACWWGGSGVARASHRPLGAQARGNGLRRRDPDGDDRELLGLAADADRFLSGARVPLAVVAARWVFRRDREIPYGPYLSLATLVVLISWKHIWPAAERVFSLGIFVPAMGLVMCVMLYLSLTVMQWTKRLLGFPDFEPEDKALWQSADQLFHFAGDNATGNGHADWRRPQWPGVGAARGSLFEQRWRQGR